MLSPAVSELDQWIYTALKSWTHYPSPPLPRGPFSLLSSIVTSQMSFSILTYIYNYKFFFTSVQNFEHCKRTELLHCTTISRPQNYTPWPKHINML